MASPNPARYSTVPDAAAEHRRRSRQCLRFRCCAIIPGVARVRRPTILSLILAGFGIFFLFVFITTGIILALIAAGILLITSPFARKRESFDEYRERYERQYGISDDEEDR